jgi:hypothetical protein
MVKLRIGLYKEVMKTYDTPVLPPSPSLLAALRAGFDSITNHVFLIFFPVALDLLLWWGPQLRLTQLIQLFVAQLTKLYSFQDSGVEEMLSAGQESWMLLAERFNLLSALRSYPVGIPSLMVSRLPVETPAGSPLVLEINSLGFAFFFWLAITMLGLVAGTLYFSIVAQAALVGQVQWRQVLDYLPRAAFQVILLALFWAGLLVVVSIPGSFLLSLAALSGFSLIQCALFLYSGFLLWLIFPLIFSTHGIFVHKQNVINSLKTSWQVTRLTLPTTGLFFLAAFFISKGLDMLWQTPVESSWLSLLGVAGHAFVTTGLLAASFVYYRDADRWSQSVLQQIRWFSSVQELKRKT